MLVVGVLACAGAGCLPRSAAHPRPLDLPDDPAGNSGPPSLVSPTKYGLGYLEQIHPRLQRAWSSFVRDCQQRLAPSHPLNRSDFAVVVAFAVDRGGELVAARVQRTSHQRDFDAAAVEIVRESARYPRPPLGLLSDDGRAHLQWTFARDHRQAGLAGARVLRFEWSPERAIPAFLHRGDVTAAALRLHRTAARFAPDAPAAARQTLVDLGDQIAAAALRAALRSQDSAVQRSAVEAAGRGRIAALAGDLRAVASASIDHGLRAQAIHALAALGDRDSVPLLLSVLAGEGGEADRATRTAAQVAAAQALAALGAAPKVRALLIDSVQSGDNGRRQMALSVMAQFAVPEAEATVVALVEGKTPGRATRIAACRALGVMAGSGASEAVGRVLGQGLKVRDAGVRAACAHAVAIAAAGGLRGRSWHAAIARLLGDSDERVRAGAVLAAAFLAPQRLVYRLRRLRTDKSAIVNTAVAQALAGVPGPAALAELVLLRESAEADVRRAAASALLERPEASARAAVAAMLADGDAEIRRLALAAVTDLDVLDPYLRGGSPALQGAAWAAVVAARGKAAVLADLWRLVGEAPEASERRVFLASAWLAPR